MLHLSALQSTHPIVLTLKKPRIQLQTCFATILRWYSELRIMKERGKEEFIRGKRHVVKLLDMSRDYQEKGEGDVSDKSESRKQSEGKVRREKKVLGCMFVRPHLRNGAPTAQIQANGARPHTRV